VDHFAAAVYSEPGHCGRFMADVSLGLADGGGMGDQEGVWRS
jgi:hypothetical protein